MGAVFTAHPVTWGAISVSLLRGVPRAEAPSA
jgi:hypothetical protein